LQHPTFVRALLENVGAYGDTGSARLLARVRAGPRVVGARARATLRFTDSSIGHDAAPGPGMRQPSSGWRKPGAPWRVPEETLRKARAELRKAVRQARDNGVHAAAVAAAAGRDELSEGRVVRLR
jgi:hypothetical protein